MSRYHKFVPLISRTRTMADIMLALWVYVFNSVPVLMLQVQLNPLQIAGLSCKISLAGPIYTFLECVVCFLL